VDEETLTVEYATDTLDRKHVGYEGDGRQLREVNEPRSTRPAPPQRKRSCRNWRM
jgi:hypothetical protein